MNKRITKYLPLAMIGPVMTSGLIWMAEGFRVMALFAGLGIASVLVLITWISAGFVKLTPKEQKTITMRIAGISYLIAIAIVALIASSDKFIIVAILFAPVFATPTIISFSPFWAMILLMKEEEAHQ